jgi:ferredoxin-thioredoxin reductase catalytic chain
LIKLDDVRKRAESDAKSRGYYLNPDQSFLKDLLEGLKTNEERYAYPSCPCRIAAGKLELDRDIICPCDYRDPDVEEYGSCYCALYVRKEQADSKMPIQPVPERRPQEKITRAMAFATGYTGEKQSKADEGSSEQLEEGKVQVDADWSSVGTGKMKFWYCKQCGYVCYREDPPYICPICKAKKEMFAEISIKLVIKG